MYLTAYNRAGMSKPSQTMNISTLGSRPFLAFAPQSLTQVNSTWIRVRLSEAWNDGNCPIHSFRVLYRENNQYQWKTGNNESYIQYFATIHQVLNCTEIELNLENPLNLIVDESLNREKRSVYILGLREETTYVVKISATNDAGTTEVTVTADTLGSLRKSRFRDGSSTYICKESG